MMARSTLMFICLLGLAAVAMAIDDDQCEAEMEKVMMKYTGQACYDILKGTITETDKSKCLNEKQYFDCFALQEDSWTDLYDDCEDLFDNSACLKSLGDDQFERRVKDSCDKKRRNLMAQYDSADPCLTTIKSAVYATTDATCPTQKDLAVCLYKFEDDWTDATDDCEDMFAKSGCSWLSKMGDDEFERFVKENSAVSAAAGAATALLAAGMGAVALLLL